MSTQVTHAVQDYLKALYSLGASDRPASTTSLAARLRVSKPSVTGMLRRLSKARLVDYHVRGGARLTASGRREALRVIRRHRILESFLTEVLGLDWSEVHDEAEILEHALSPRVERAIEALLSRRDEDPHGHPIPAADGTLRVRTLAPFQSVESGETVVVREVPDGSRERLSRWKKAGLVPGARVHVTRVDRVDDIYELEIAGRPLVLGSEGLAGILVERLRNRRRR